MSSDPLVRILSKLKNAKKVPGGWQGSCPSHDDHAPSLSIAEGADGRILLHDHGGCSLDAILSALNLTLDDLFRPRDGLGDPLATYDYVNEDGQLLFQVVRYPNTPDGTKHFKQRRPDGAGGWIWHLDQTRRVLYQLDRLQGKTGTFVVEGERDADRLWALGLPATTNPGGAGKWKDEYAQQLLKAGVRHVCVLADNDPPGDSQARSAGESCHKATLGTKVLLLPGLPPKGDVSDWLDAGHTKAELLALVKATPPFKPGSQLRSAPLKMEFTCVTEFLTEREEEMAWLVEHRIPRGSLILLAGKPKVGKSTLARSLALAVAGGAPWLGHAVEAGPVWYVALEDKRSEVRAHFRQMGATGTERLWIAVGEVPADALEQIRERATREKPVLIIIDGLQRLIRADDLNDYAEVTTKLTPLLSLCRETGAAVVLTHHTNKYSQGLDSILGSTALAGSVDNLLLLCRGERHRTLQSMQRIGPDLEPTVVELDPDSREVRFAGTQEEVETTETGALILAALDTQTEPQTERWLRGEVDAAPKVQARALRQLLRAGRIFRLGKGQKGHAYQYGRARTPRVSPESPAVSRPSPPRTSPLDFTPDEPPK